MSCPVCGKNFSKISIIGHVEVCLQFSDKQSTAQVAGRQNKAVKGGSVLSHATVVKPADFHEYIEILSQSPVGKRGREEVGSNKVKRVCPIGQRDSSIALSQTFSDKKHTYIFEVSI